MSWSLKSLYPRGRLWRHRDFMNLWTGQRISEFGTQVSQPAISLVEPGVLPPAPMPAAPDA